VARSRPPTRSQIVVVSSIHARLDIERGTAGGAGGELFVRTEDRRRGAHRRSAVRKFHSWTSGGSLFRSSRAPPRMGDARRSPCARLGRSRSSRSRWWRSRDIQDVGGQKSLLLTFSVQWWPHPGGPDGHRMTWSRRERYQKTGSSPAGASGTEARVQIVSYSAHATRRSRRTVLVKRHRLESRRLRAATRCGGYVLIRPGFVSALGTRTGVRVHRR